MRSQNLRINLIFKMNFQTLLLIPFSSTAESLRLSIVSMPKLVSQICARACGYIYAQDREE